MQDRVDRLRLSRAESALWASDTGDLVACGRRLDRRAESEGECGVTKSLSALKVKLFADGADKCAMLQHYANPQIQGFTTNPTLMRKAGLRDYESFARDVLSVIRDRPISFEVFADEFPEMARQAHKIASWAENVYVKIPVTNTRGEPSLDLMRHLSHARLQLNLTALLPHDQVRDV